MRAAIMVWLMMAGAALAAPAEAPPDDFRGAQYIDSAGCVFMLDGTAWTARLDTEGAVICGYPPSLTSRRADASEPEPDALQSPEQALSETLAHGLRDGELTADSRPREERRPAPPVKTPASSPLADLPALVVAAPALRREMGADLNPNRRLCDLLGYPADGTTAPGLGADATQGFCGGGAVDQELHRIVTGPAMVTPTAAAAPDQQPAAAAPSMAAKPERIAHGDTKAASATPATRGPTTGAARTVPKRSGPGPELIPAGARFVHLGAFGDEQSRSIIVGRLRELGYPVARGRAQNGPGSGLYAGPFRDRRSLVAALNDLRARGIGRPVAR